MTTDTATVAIEHLDFAHTQPCEHSQHAKNHADEPAMFLITVSPCPRCGDPGRPYSFLCLSGWERLGRGPVGHGPCGYRGTREDFGYRIVRVIGTTT